MVLKLYLVAIKLFLSDMNKYRNVRNTPRDRKQSLPAQLFKIKKAIITSTMTAFTVFFIRLRFIDKKKHKAKASENFSVKPIFIYWVFIL